MRAITTKIEEMYPQMMERFGEITTEQYELVCKKQYDNGSGNITLGGELENESVRMLTRIALVLRMNDKVNRLYNRIFKTHGKKTVADDTYMDACRDITVSV